MGGFKTDLNFWYLVPTCNPRIEYFAKWKERGYKIAAQVSSEDLANQIKDHVDLTLTCPFNSLPAMFNKLAIEIGKFDYVIAACDETYPSSNHTVDDVVNIYLSHFPDNFGVLSPKGDRYGSTTCVQNPIISMDWCNKFGVFPSGYHHFYADTELYFRSKLLGKLVEDERISFYHDHWMRKSESTPPYLIKSRSLEWADEVLFNNRMKEMGYSGY